MYALPLIAAILPSALVLLGLHVLTRDLTVRLVVGAFLAGAAMLGFVYVTLALHDWTAPDLSLGPWLTGLYRGVVLASVPEELARVLVLWAVVRRSDAGDSPTRALVLGAVIALGFASLESAIYVASENRIYVEARVWVGLWRRVTTAIPLHVGLGVIAGSCVRAATRADGPTGERGPWRALLVAVVLHGSYDAPLLIRQALGERASAVEGALLVGVSYLILAAVIGAAMWLLVRAQSELRRTRPAVTGRGTTTSA